MYNWNMAKELPSMLAGMELKEKLMVLPDYDEDIKFKSQAERLMALNKIYNIYLPSQMSCEIYSKIYLAMLRSLQKKDTKQTVQQRNANFKGIKKQSEYTGIVGGSDSFTIIGASGIGKSSAISRAIKIATDDKIIEMENPYCKIIPALTVQTPFDCSVKSLLLEILRVVDEELDTHYFDMAVKSKATVDVLIGSVSQVCLNHIGLLVVDEIQNVVFHKNGRQLIGALTQLINLSGISICMVGVPESAEFFEEIPYLARRALGLVYDKCDYNDYFRKFCEVLFYYQYVQNESELTDGMIQWLYEHSGGVLAVVVALVHDAQELSILNGREILDKASLMEAYEQRMRMLHSHITTATKIKKASKKRKMVEVVSQGELHTEEKEDRNSFDGDWTFRELIESVKRDKSDILELLKNRISIEEVVV